MGLHGLEQGYLYLLLLYPVAPVSTKFGVMVEDLFGEILDA
jgi:hypothetical protein